MLDACCRLSFGVVSLAQWCVLRWLFLSVTKRLLWRLISLGDALFGVFFSLLCGDQPRCSLAILLCPTLRTRHIRNLGERGLKRAAAVLLFSSCFVVNPLRVCPDPCEGPKSHYRYIEIGVVVAAFYSTRTRVPKRNFYLRGRCMGNMKRIGKGSVSFLSAQWPGFDTG